MYDLAKCEPGRHLPRSPIFHSLFGGVAASMLFAALPGLVGPAQAQEQRPNIVMLMTDDTGWNDFGAYTGGGAAPGHPTPDGRVLHRARTARPARAEPEPAHAVAYPLWERQAQNSVSER